MFLLLLGYVGIIPNSLYTVACFVCHLSSNILFCVDVIKEMEIYNVININLPNLLICALGQPKI